MAWKLWASRYVLYVSLHKFMDETFAHACSDILYSISVHLCFIYIKLNSWGIIYLTYKYYFTTPNSTQGSVDSA
jgi:hypothetical protein